MTANNSYTINAIYTPHFPHAIPMRGPRKVVPVVPMRVPVAHKEWKILQLGNEKEETLVKRCFQCGKELKEYCEMTTLHGCRYLVEPRRSLIERIYWIVALIFVYAGVSYSIYDQLWLYIRAPVLMSLDSNPTPVWDLPFPAVTICSENRLRPSTFNYTGVMMRRNYSEKEKNFLQYAAVTCSIDLAKDGLEYIDTKYLNEITEKGFAACNSTFMGIRWLKTERTSDVCDMLQRRLTDVGTCYTFNSLAFKHMFKKTMFHGPQYEHESKREAGELMWTPDGGYVTKADVAYPPWRVSGGSSWQGAIFLLNLDINDLDETCTYGGHGFLVAVHNPIETAPMSMPAVYAKTDHFTQIAVMPKQQLTNAELMYWPPEKRGCYHGNERQLQFFQYYSRRNCDLECETNITLATCGCVAIYQPRLESTPVCGAKKLDCIIDSMVHTLGRINNADDNMCQCLSSCTELEYEIEVYSMPRNFSMSKGKILEEYLGSKHDQNNFALVKVHFQSRKITATERIAVFGLTDFIANIGGLMGLFLGFSFLSLFEIFYFIFLRYNKSCRSSSDQQISKNKKHQQPQQVFGSWPVMYPK